MVHDAGSPNENHILGTRLEATENLVLWEIPTNFSQEYITVLQYVVFKAMCKTPALFLTLAAGPRDFITHEDVAENMRGRRLKVSWIFTRAANLYYRLTFW